MSTTEEPLGDVATTLLFSNELVNVWEMLLEPGESSDRHRHDHPYLLCVLEGTSVDATQDGRPGRVHIPVQQGSVFFVPPGATETAVNASGTRFREILIELKGPVPEGVAVQVANVPAPAERRP
jgi:quercetin dioxygenase-like cupin family protein